MSTEQSDPLGDTPGKRIISYLIGVPTVTVLTIIAVLFATSPVLDQLRNADPQRFSFAVTAVFGIGIWFGTSWASGNTGEMSEEDSNESLGDFIAFGLGLVLVFNMLVILAAAAGNAVLGVGSPILALLVAFGWPMWEAYTVSRDGWPIPLSVLGGSAFIFQLLDQISEWGGKLADAISSYSIAPEHLFWSIRRRAN